MKNLILMTILVGGCCSCATHKIVMYPAVVGTKTSAFEVVSSKELQLPAGVKSTVVAGPCGPKSGIVILLDNPGGGTGGGYMVCGCTGNSSSCTVTNDNPEHAFCDGSCFSSEGKASACQLFGPLPGPPKDPAYDIQLQATKVKAPPI